MLQNLMGGETFGMAIFEDIANVGEHMGTVHKILPGNAAEKETVDSFIEF